MTVNALNSRAGERSSAVARRHTGSLGPTWLRRGTLLSLILALAFGLSGCLQLGADLSVGKNDTVSGRILLAGDNAEETSVLNGLSVPTGLEEKVRISNYAANNYSGKEIYFTELSFADVDTLVIGLQVDNSRPYSMSFRRSGSKVTFEGSIDLTGVPQDQTGGIQSRIDLSFPAPVESTNGNSEDDPNRVSWSPQAGTVSTLEASTNYPDPATRGFAVWLIVGIGAAVLVSILVILLARSSRARADAGIRRSRR